MIHTSRRCFVTVLGTAVLGGASPATLTPRFSCSTYEFMSPERTRRYPRFTLEETVRSMAGIGYCGIEVVSIDNEFDLGLDSLSIASFRKLLDKHNMQMVCLSPYNMISFTKTLRGQSPDREIESVCRWVDLAVKLGAPLLRVGATGIESGLNVPRAKVVEALAGPITKCAEYAKLRHIKLVTETHGWSWVRFPDNAKALMDAIDSDHFGILLHTRPKESEEVIALAGKRILHLHLCDMRTNHERKKMIESMRPRLDDATIMAILRITRAEMEQALSWEDPGTALFTGEGDVNFAAIVRGLREIGYGGWWNFEGHMFTNPTGPGPEEDARRAYGYFRRMFGRVPAKA